MRTKAPQFRGVMSWIQIILIFQLVKENAVILDLDGSDGVHIGKYQRHKKPIKEYICISESEGESKAAHDKWMKKQKPFEAQFYKNADKDIEKLIGFQESNQPKREPNIKGESKKMYDHIVSFGGAFERYCGSEKSPTAIRNFLKAIRGKLNPNGGTAFGVVMDDSTMWSRYGSNASDKSSHGGVFDVSYLDASRKRVELKITAEKKPYVGTPIHCPTLLRAASELGLEVCNLTNCYDLFQDYQHIYKMDLDAFQVFRNNQVLKKPDIALLQMFHIIILRRQGPLEPSIQFCHQVCFSNEHEREEDKMDTSS